MRVLIIEDDAFTATDLKLTAADLGFSEVLLAQDEVGAVEIAKGAHPDLIICDVRMGASVSGVRAVNAIYGRAQRRFVTGLLSANDSVVDADGVVVLGKPYDTKSLVKAIGRTATKPRRQQRGCRNRLTGRLSRGFGPARAPVR